MGGSSTAPRRNVVAYAVAPLFTVETDRLRLTWSGPPAAQRGADPLWVCALGAGRLAVDADGAADVWLEEETGYPVLLQSLDGSAVELRHRDPVVTAGLVSVEGGRVVHGRVRCGSQAGRARFELWAGGEAQAEVGVSVLPTKLSEAEVGAMRAEVEAAAAGLSLAALRPTTLAASGGPAAPSVPVWLAGLRTGLGALAAAVAEIERRPTLALARPLERVRAGRVTRATSATRRAAGRWGLGAPVLPAQPPRTTADTPAHRWLAARLAETERRLRQLVRDEGRRRPSARRAAVIDEVDEMAGALGRLRARPVVRDARGPAPAVAPLVVRRRPAYAAAFDALRALDRGLDLRAGALDLATHDLAVLYETWAALAVARVAAEVLGAEPPERPFGVQARGTDVVLRRGRAHAVRLEGRGVRVEVVYNPRFPAPPALVAQRPDLVLTISDGRPPARDGARPRRVVLDAKYRRDDSAGYRRRYGAAGPPEDALGTLHRYRDAIADGGPPVETAAALFPGAETDAETDAFRDSRLWTSLETLGVGAVPLRPGHTAALAAFIGGLLSDGPG